MHFASFCHDEGARGRELFLSRPRRAMAAKTRTQKPTKGARFSSLSGKTTIKKQAKRTVQRGIAAQKAGRTPGKSGPGIAVPGSKGGILTGVPWCSRSRCALPQADRMAPEPLEGRQRVVSRSCGASLRLRSCRSRPRLHPLDHLWSGNLLDQWEVNWGCWRSALIQEAS